MEERLEEFINKYSDEDVENKSSDAAISFVAHQVKNIEQLSFFIQICLVFMPIIKNNSFVAMDTFHKGVWSTEIINVIQWQNRRKSSL